MKTIFKSDELEITQREDQSVEIQMYDSMLSFPLENFRAMIREIAVKCEANSQMFLVIRNAVREANETKDYAGAIAVIAGEIGEPI